MYLNFVNGTAEYICDASCFQKNNTIIIIFIWLDEDELARFGTMWCLCVCPFLVSHLTLSPQASLL